MMVLVVEGIRSMVPNIGVLQAGPTVPPIRGNCRGSRKGLHVCRVARAPI